MVRLKGTKNRDQNQVSSLQWAVGHKVDVVGFLMALVNY